MNRNSISYKSRPKEELKKKLGCKEKPRRGDDRRRKERSTNKDRGLDNVMNRQETMLIKQMD
jgi:hypothetical protein